METSLYLAPWVGLILLMSAHLASRLAAGRAPLLLPVMDIWRLRLKEGRPAAIPREFDSHARL